MKLRVGIIFGGKSAEHEVSIQSAKNINEALDRSKYEVLLVGIDKEGVWHLGKDGSFILNASNPKLISIDASAPSIVPLERPGNALALFSPKSGEILGEVDVFFPITHGTFGEDGSLQGLFRLLNVPYTGADVLGSAIGLDKDVMKRLLVQAGLPVPDFRVLCAHELESTDFTAIAGALGLPLFVKPCNLGSSVGISKVGGLPEVKPAVVKALRYDRKVILESAVKGREIECAVLGNEAPIVSLCGEVVPTRDFYSYDAKYIDEDGARLLAPAELEPDLQRSVRELAVKAFRVLECQGMARVDTFIESSGRVILNEINTLPGFTRISMYPRLWALSGIPYPELLDHLINLALDRRRDEAKLNREVVD